MTEPETNVRHSLIPACIFLCATAAFAQQSPEQKCAALTSPGPLPNQTTLINTAVLKPASVETGSGRGAVPALPQHCEIRGKMNQRTGANAQHYAINFHMRLPIDWNKKFFFEGGGGSNGNIGEAYGNLQGQQTSNALTLGYAVVSQDSGHDNAVNNDPKLNGTQTFGFDEQARRDFGYNSYDQVTQAAKALIKVFYGQAPDRSYYVGCSEGGREAMMMSQRFPEYFDGILACSPGFKLPRAAIAEAWDSQAFAEVARESGLKDPLGEPFLNKTFTDEDLALVASATLAACDKLDGVEDGIIANFTSCKSTLVKPKLAAIGCKGAKDAACLSAQQIAALEKAYGGPKNSKGESLYADWAWDAGIGGKLGPGYNQGWRVWKLGVFNAPQNSSINTGLGSESVSAIFMAPPIPVPSTGAAPIQFALHFNFDTDPPKIFSQDFMKADATDLSAFRKHGGKLLITHGVSDPVFSVNDTISWVKEIDKINKGKAADFVRFFAVPGMNHCSGGPATDRYNAFGALVDWVENKTAPAQIVATAGPATAWPGRTRPLCQYPATAHYKGTGSIEEAASFVCK
jgi:pimeloyl-ACP methyl ester carboxylesterase